MSVRAGDAALALAIGARIRALRNDAGITQERLAWSCDISKPYMCQIEAGKRLPSLPIIIAIAAELGVHPADIIAFNLNDPRSALLDAIRRSDHDTIKCVLEQFLTDDP